MSISGNGVAPMLLRFLVRSTVLLGDPIATLPVIP
jgi:hypothetical protein